MHRRILVFFVAAAVLGASTSALAQPTTPGVVSGGHVLTDNQTTAPLNEAPPLSIFPMKEDKLIDPRMVRSWSTAPARWFVSSTIDIGFVYARPRAAFGYGKPFTSWVGVEANPIVTQSGLGVYGGLRLELPYFDFRIGPRYFFAFNHTYLNDQTSYDRLALETSEGKAASVITYEAEVETSIPAGPGNILLRGSASHLNGVPDGMSVFEETLYVIVRGPWVWRARGGYAFTFGAYSQHSIGVVAEVLDVPGRDDSVTVRAGPIMRFVLSRRVELRATFVLTAVSPDRIGLVGADFGELGVRYRWATE